MTSMGDFTICGKRGGTAFKDAERPDSNGGGCPDGFI
jgi:hypothetical protein